MPNRPLARRFRLRELTIRQVFDRALEAVWRGAENADRIVRPEKAQNSRGVRVSLFDRTRCGIGEHGHPSPLIPAGCTGDCESGGVAVAGSCVGAAEPRLGDARSSERFRATHLTNGMYAGVARRYAAN